MQFKIQESKQNISFDEISALTESVGWGKFHQSEEKWRHILSVSSHIAYIKQDDQLIAFGRIMEDGVMCMFYDICVHPDYQKQKIGTLIMNHLIQKINETKYACIGLFVWDGNKTASQFYNKFGFQIVPAMELRNISPS